MFSLIDDYIVTMKCLTSRLRLNIDNPRKCENATANQLRMTKAMPQATGIKRALSNKAIRQYLRACSITFHLITWTDPSRWLLQQ